MTRRQATAPERATAQPITDRAKATVPANAPPAARTATVQCCGTAGPPEAARAFRQIDALTTAGCRKVTGRGGPACRAALTSGGLYVPFSLQVTLGQDYLPSRIGTASGVTLGLTVSTGGLLSPLLGHLADTTSPQTALTPLVAMPALSWLLFRALPEPAAPGPGRPHPHPHPHGKTRRPARSSEHTSTAAPGQCARGGVARSAGLVHCLRVPTRRPVRSQPVRESSRLPPSTAFRSRRPRSRAPRRACRIARWQNSPQTGGNLRTDDPRPGFGYQHSRRWPPCLSDARLVETHRMSGRVVECPIDENGPS